MQQSVVQPIIKALKRMRACEDSLQFMLGMTTWQEAWDKCQMGTWMDWYLRNKLKVEIKSVSARTEAMNEVGALLEMVEKDGPCSCGCGLNLFIGPVGEKKLAALFREKYPVAPTSPAELEKNERFDAYFSDYINFTST